MAILSEGNGYGVVLGFGALFALIMTTITFLCKRYLHEVQTSEMYMTAQRTVKTGLVASAIVSSWTWAATLLTSTEVAYKYGVSGPIWYASGAVVQVLLFAVLAIELKRRAPNAHTFLEVVLARYGKGAHGVYLFFATITNILITAMLLLGGSAVVNYLTGMHTIAACFLLPVGVVVYTLFGGIKATFMSDYAHTVVIFIIIISFVFTVYGTSPKIGSIGTMYDLLVAASERTPIVDNEKGSLVTMSSIQALLFGIINICGNFGTVFLDNAYWQRAIAAHPQYAVKAYLIGGLSWFAIPFTLATTMGLAGRALDIQLTPFAISQGLVLPDVAIALLGKAGGFACLILVFMAVTSAASAELIAVSSVMTYDVYRTYIRPNAKGKEVVRFSHICVVTFGILMGVLAVLLNLTGISLGYLYTLMGVLISSAVVPLTMTLLWSKQSKAAAIASPIIGFIAAVGTWLGVTSNMYGEITVNTTSQNYPMMAGNIVALVSPIFITVAISLIKPDHFNFDATRDIQQVDDSNQEQIAGDFDERNPKPAVAVAVAAEAVTNSEEEMEAMAKSSRFAKVSSIVLSLVLFLLWPLPMFLSKYVFSKSFFTGWVVVSIIWVFASTIAVGIYPIYESRQTIASVFAEIWRDITGKRVPNLPTTNESAMISEENIIVYNAEKKDLSH
ncbi:Sodium:solute symporter family-domain-containing protein [Mucor mucedo]|uniref:Sodium:solute symporter family-domain-containing protein n=1 Tax=Mucor mucedo TaxID=29922 RepID=UPI00221F3807|nr:Sodium:solute symporter family-domain-containing protein [Mucor mucedo]KAI7890476.1 Sodium:solute symporter family-domain-containing protein [Mucor mucedo]